MQVTVELFCRQLMRRMALRLADDLEPGKFVPPTTPFSSTGGNNSAVRQPPPFAKPAY